MHAVPVIDISALRSTDDSPAATSAVAAALDSACRDTGFFCIVGHGVSCDLMSSLDRCARAFFALPTSTKSSIAMANGGRAWRGWFPLGGEMTNGIPDRKEGIYFGSELGDDDPRVATAVPLHGANQFPAELPELRDAVLAWIDALTEMGHLVLGGLAAGLGLTRNWFRTELASDPTILFRIFRYPPHDVAAASPLGIETGEWGVAEHTDYGLLTMLLQDDCGGLQVHGRDGWIEVEPIAGSFVCNIGDMLERITGGRYRSTPHRVRNISDRERLSFPFFFDPSWGAMINPPPLDGGSGPDAEARQRWDGRSVFEFEGTYGEYLTAKVAKVFPALVDVLS
ncbi:MAG: 2-oxoglutarate and iron-dependent oxygenase domain-containing protein [Ilumatobacteraceae bacterium]